MITVMFDTFPALSFKVKWYVVWVSSGVVKVNPPSSEYFANVSIILFPSDVIATPVSPESRMSLSSKKET